MAYAEESYLGAGDLNIDVYDSGGALTGELDVGNATIFAINAPTTDKKELTGYRRDNYGTTIKSIISKTEQELKFTLTDINRKNLALAMFGADAAYLQDAGNNTASPETVVAAHDKWVKLVSATTRNLDSSTNNKPVVTNSGATVTYTEGTHYEIDYAVGRIKALSTGTITDGQSLKVASKWLAITDGWKVTGRTLSKIEAKLRLIVEDQANSRDGEVIVYKAAIEPSGDINWLTEDFAQLEFSGKILSTDDGYWDVYFY